MVEDQVSSKAAIGTVGRVEGINHAEPVAEHIGQADPDQTLIVCVFDHTAANRGFFDHRGKFKDIHIGHAAISMAAV